MYCYASVLCSWHRWSNSTFVRNTWGNLPCIHWLPYSWLNTTIYPESPATGHFDRGLPEFPPASSKCWDSCSFPSCYCVLLKQPCLLKFIWLGWKPLNFIFKLCDTLLKKETKSRRPLSTAVHRTFCLKRLNNSFIITHASEHCSGPG